VRVFNNAGKSFQIMRLDCPVELHKNDTSIVERDAPDIIVGTYWHTYFLLIGWKTLLEHTKLCFLIQSNDKAIIPTRKTVHI